MKKLNRSEFLTDLFITPGSDKVFDAISSAVNGAKNRLSLQSFTESIMVDESWIEAIEAYLPSVEKISRKPKSFIIEDKMIVPVEKAKRITSETIRHLSSHTSNIRGIDKDGSVQPSKLLTSLLEEDLGIYENRFVMTLINRVAIFVERQYNALKGVTPSEIIKLEHHTDFEAGGYKFKYNLTTSVAKPFEEGIKDAKRVEDLMFRLSVIKSTPFFQQMRKYKQVRPPIMRTNVLKMDIDYNAAYKLWLYISACDKLGYTINHATKKLSSDSIFEQVLRLTNIYNARAFLYHLEDIGQMLEELPFRKKAKKAFKIVEKNLFTPTVIHSRETTSEEDSAKYYFELIKDRVFGEIQDEGYSYAEKLNNPDSDEDAPDAEDKRTVVIDERRKDISFNILYEQISEINESIFYDALQVDLEKPTKMPGESNYLFRRREAELNEKNYQGLKELAILKEKEAFALKKLAAKCFEKAQKSKSVSGTYMPPVKKDAEEKSILDQVDFGALEKEAKIKEQKAKKDEEKAKKTAAKQKPKNKKIESDEKPEQIVKKPKKAKKKIADSTSAEENRSSNDSFADEGVPKGTAAKKKDAREPVAGNIDENSDILQSEIIVQDSGDSNLLNPVNIAVETVENEKTESETVETENAGQESQTEQGEPQKPEGDTESDS